MSEYSSEFYQAKPAAFPMLMDIRPKKEIDPESDDAEYNLSSNFASQLSNSNTTLHSVFDTQNAATAASNTDSKAVVLDKAQGNRGIEGIYQGIGGFFSQKTLADIEQVGDYSNNENPKGTYVDLREIVGKKSNSQLSADMEKQIFNSQLLAKAQSSPGQGFTMPHNLNLLYGVGSNPFKKWDKDGNEIFQNATEYEDLHTESMSPRRILEKLKPGFWTNVNKIGEKLQNIRVKDFNGQPINQVQDDGSVNLKNIVDQFTDTQQTDASGKVTNTFDVNPNFYTIISNQLWRTMNKEDSFNFITLASEAKTRAFNVLREVMGPAKAIMSNGQSTIPDDKVAYIAKKTDEWWEKTGQNLTEAQLFPYGLLAEVAPSMSAMMNWGNWDQTKSSDANFSSDFREKMVSDYMEHINQNFADSFSGKKQISPSDLVIDSSIQGQRIFDLLRSKGVINSDGQISSNYNPAITSLNLGLPGDEEGKALSALRKAYLGNFSLETLDNASGSTVTKRNIKILGADDQYRTIDETLQLLKAGSKGEEKITNVQVAYNYFMDLYTNLTNLGLDKTGTNGAPVVTAISKLQVATSPIPNAQWQELDATGKWVTKTGPLSLSLASSASATQLQDSLRQVIAILEPLVSLFGKDSIGSAGVPKKTLIDNSLNLDENGQPIKEGSPGYQIDVDLEMPQAIFSDTNWDKISEEFGGKITQKIGEKIFSRAVGNRISSRNQKIKMERYRADLDDFENERYQQDLQANNSMVERKNEEAKQEAQRLMESKQRQSDEEKAAQAKNKNASSSSHNDSE